MKRLTILGSTGSIGTQALQIVECYPERFRVIALSAGSNYKLLARQANRFRPSLLHIRDSADVDKLSDSLDYKPEQILSGENSLENLATLESVDLVLNSLVGFAGFRPTLRALQAGKKIALANKESLVAGGELIRPLLIHSPGSLIPVDSEHSAMLQCIVGEPEGSIRKIIITASGGPFRDWSNEKLKSVRPADALRHPNWEMGAKITIDSATMMNKGLEIIEAHWLFGLPPERIEPVIHPQSIIHSVVEFTDGSSKAQLGPPDMKVPILYALTWPERVHSDLPTIDWSVARKLTFSPISGDRFPCLWLAMDALRTGGHAPAVLNAANEVAVQHFINGEIDYIRIPEIIEESLGNVHLHTELSEQSLTETDAEARAFAESLV